METTRTVGQPGITEKLTRLLWTTQRVARRWCLTLVGRNPLVRGRRAPGWAFESRSVAGLRRSRALPPVKLREDETGELWSTSIGEFWTPPRANHDFVRQLAAEMEAEVYDLSGIVREGAVVIDCGANVGFFTRWALMHGASKVICFEPSPGNVACLRRNLEPEIAAGRAIVIEKGVWDREAVLSFSTKNLGNPGGHHIAENNSGNLQIEVTTIDGVCDQLGVTHVDYLKLDVEGAEQKALIGARNVVQRSRPNLCVVTEHTDDLFTNAEQVIETIRSIDPRYQYRCTESHPYRSPSRGLVLTPYSTLFYPGPE